MLLTSYMDSTMVIFSVILPIAGKIPYQQILVSLPVLGHIHDSFQFTW